MGSKGVHLIIISMLVFGVLNIIENLIHYNIGRSYKDYNFTFHTPSQEDFIKIIIVMIIFALAQGFLTELFMKD
jgi:hypothetical protein